MGAGLGGTVGVGALGGTTMGAGLGATDGATRGTS
jgi:hypothetical protein